MCDPARAPLPHTTRGATPFHPAGQPRDRWTKHWELSHPKENSRTPGIPVTKVTALHTSTVAPMAHRCQRWDTGQHRNGEGWVPSTLAESALVPKLLTLHDPVRRAPWDQEEPTVEGVPAAPTTPLTLA